MGVRLSFWLNKRTCIVRDVRKPFQKREVHMLFFRVSQVLFQGRSLRLEDVPSFSFGLLGAAGALILSAPFYSFIRPSTIPPIYSVPMFKPRSPACFPRTPPRSKNIHCLPQSLTLYSLPLSSPLQDQPPLNCRPHVFPHRHSHLNVWSGSGVSGFY